MCQLEAAENTWQYEVYLLSRVEARPTSTSIEIKPYRQDFHADSTSADESTDEAYQPRKVKHYARKTMKEQAVDEVLHGRIYEALFENRDRLKGTTLVLGTGDGNASEFSTGGFLRPGKRRANSFHLARFWLMRLCRYSTSGVERRM